jgi:hypothetical protein
VIVPIR